ncbi:MAG: presenilin family intramembrane aspartyl protease [Candidatus Pacearchaeota archaeon]|jgi:presenilin-like A22 family membrane protease
MKHTLKVTAIILVMFIITQFIGLFVVGFYFNHELPYGLGYSQPVEQSYAPAFISILIAFVIAISLVFLLTKFKSRFFLRLWFFVVVLIALGVSFSSILFNFSTEYRLMSFIALLFALPIALSKVYSRNLISHNLSELLIYPGIAAIFVPILNVFYLILLLVLISLYDMWAVWKSGIMQKMAKYQMDQLKVFSGFLIPYLTKQQRDKIKKLKIKNQNSKFVKKEIKVSAAILGGGDVVFPIIASGVMLKAFSPNFIPAILVIIGAVLGLGFLFLISKKNKFYPAMPFISAGIFLAIGISYLIF